MLKKLFDIIFNRVSHADAMSLFVKAKAKLARASELNDIQLKELADKIERETNEQQKIAKSIEVMKKLLGEENV